MLNQYIIRKDYQGNIISEQIRPVTTGSTIAELQYLGALLAEKLTTDIKFREFCQKPA